jgi:UDP-2-acetamido-3-amino-2,3-dideoxy-glucuronate N-acetyltransferase
MNILRPEFQNIRLAIIGCGRWGRNHVRTAHEILGDNLRMVCDANSEAEASVRGLSAAAQFTTRLEDVYTNPDINCVIIATPAPTHHAIARACLLQDKHVLVEKPMTLTTSHARELVKLADERDLVVMVGHVLLFHPAIIRLKQEIRNGRIGRLQYIYSNRLNLGTVRADENILWSFAPHDVSIMQFLTESYPVAIDAKGASFLRRKVEDTTLTYLTYPGNVHAHIFVSWLHPFKEHRLMVIGSQGMMVFDDHLREEKLKFYPNGFSTDNGQLHKFEGHYEAIQLDGGEPLSNEQRHFFECVQRRKTPITDGRHGLQVLDILAKAQSKLQRHTQTSPALHKATRRRNAAVLHARV